MSRRRGPGDDDRGQTVLLAAAVLALALVPMTVAYLQLSAHPDVAAGHDDPDGERTVTELERVLYDARAGVPATYAWENRTDAVATVRARAATPIDRLERAGVADGVTRSVTYNETAAARRASEACPGGPAREFGDCDAIDGVVVQDRLGETHVLAAAFDVRVTTDRGTTRLTVVVEVAAEGENVEHRMVGAEVPRSSERNSGVEQTLETRSGSTVGRS